MKEKEKVQAIAAVLLFTVCIGYFIYKVKKATNRAASRPAHSHVHIVYPSDDVRCVYIDRGNAVSIVCDWDYRGEKK